jgi:hypothetical protein
VSNELEAGIREFPSPVERAEDEAAPTFGWGRPLDSDGASPLPRPSPDGFTFIRLPSGTSDSALYLSSTEATNQQLKARLKDYDPAAGRSDEFSLEAGEQPALNLTPERALAYLAALGATDKSGVTYRLPTHAEWLRAARAGKDTPFWWGDQPRYPEGANFLGPEPALPTDSTAPSLPAPTPPAFGANPWGLYHTFGNVAEWATEPAGGFARLGGHFRTEPANPLPEPTVADAKARGDDAFVGVRPAFELSAQSAAALAKRALGDDAPVKEVQVQFDPRRQTLILTGQVADKATRRAADERLSAPHAERRSGKTRAPRFGRANAAHDHARGSAC